MPDDFLSNSAIVAAYREKTPESARLAKAARQLFPSGVTHDVRFLKPYGIYVERAQGAHKWDADGNEYVDYVGGHGAMLLGHSHPKIVAAVNHAMENGSHFGANHGLEVRWAELICEMVPCAQRVRFTSSGTEATLLALRLARAHTDRKKIIRFKTHFHGWHDHVTAGITSHFAGEVPTGVIPDIVENVVLMAPWDLDAVTTLIERDDDIAGVILEPTGATFGMVPFPAGFLEALREVTAEHGVVLIFDEVVTGFRVSPGGAQAHFGITPDITTLGKIIAGGMPGGAVAGATEILEALDFDATERLGREKIQHQGTFNANPVCCAAGIAALEIIATSDVCERANASGAELRRRLNDVIIEKGIPWAAYGAFSSFQLFTNPQNRDVSPDVFDPFDFDYLELKSNPVGLPGKLRLAMLVNGVDISGWPGGTITSAHTQEDLEKTAQAFSESLDVLMREGEI